MPYKIHYHGLTNTRKATVENYIIHDGENLNGGMAFNRDIESLVTPHEIVKLIFQMTEVAGEDYSKFKECLEYPVLVYKQKTV